MEYKRNMEGIWKKYRGNIQTGEIYSVQNTAIIGSYSVPKNRLRLLYLTTSRGFPSLDQKRALFRPSTSTCKTDEMGDTKFWKQQTKNRATNRTI